MTLKSKKHDKGIRLKSTDSAATLDGEIRNDKTDKELKVYLDSAERVIVTEDQVQTLSNKTIDATDASGTGSISIDASDATYDDTAEVAETLGTNVQSALDAVKVLIDGQNEASEIDYAPAVPSDYDVTPAKVKPALDELAQRINDSEDGVAVTDGKVTDLITLSGNAANATHNGTFTGSTINDNVVTKVALQDLETELETKITASSTDLLTNKSIISPNRLDVKQDIESTLVTYAAGVDGDDGQLCFATDTLKMFQIIGGILQPVGGGGSTSFEIAQAAHGFVVGTGIYHDNGTGTYKKAKSDDSATLAYHIVVEVVDAGIFIAADFGRVEVELTTNPDSLAAGSYYFQSEATLGLPTSTEPSTGFSNPLFYVETLTGSSPNVLATLQVKCLRPDPVGEAIPLDELSDVAVPSPVSEDFLKYNGSSWENAKVEEQVISITATENMAIRTPVYIKSDGDVGKLDVDSDTNMEFIGFTREVATATNPVQVSISGKMGGFSGLTIGEFVYGDPTTPGTIVQPEPTQANVYIIKLGKAISATEIIINPDLAASAEFNRDVVADTTITNNQSSAANITGVSFDGTVYRSALINYSIYRKTDTNEKAQVGQLRLVYKTVAASWSISDSYGGDDAGVTFSIDGTGQVQYTSTDLTGASYTSDLKITTAELFEV